MGLAEVRSPDMTGMLDHTHQNEGMQKRELEVTLNSNRPQAAKTPEEMLRDHLRRQNANTTTKPPKEAECEYNNVSTQAHPPEFQRAAKARNKCLRRPTPQHTGGPTPEV